MAYLDEALKLDARALMAMPMKEGIKNRYSVKISCGAGEVICRDLRSKPDRVAIATIIVHWPDHPTEAVTGGIWLSYLGWDDRAAEQSVSLTGTPAKIGGYVWRLTCPDTSQPVQALYLAPDGDRFQSRHVSGLKYRRATSTADRHLRRCVKLMHKLKADHFGPGIGKPAGMSNRTFDKLDWQLTKESIRYYSALLGKPPLDFPDEEPAPRPSPPRPKTTRPPAADKRVALASMYFRDGDGDIKMHRKFNKKFGPRSHEVLAIDQPEPVQRRVT